MDLNQHIQTRQIQKQTVTPQLLQGVQLLQLSREELLSYFNQKMLENPLIEVTIPEQDDFSLSYSSAEQDLSWIPDTNQTLREFVNEQVTLSYRDTYLREMIFWWINHLDENGYVTKDVEESAKETGANKIQMLDALTLLQQLEPAGIGARNLQECFMLQTERMNDAPNIAYIVLEESFEEFVGRKWETIAKRYNVTLEEVQEVFDFVKRLSPKPGAVFSQSDPTLVLPELNVSISNQELEVKETSLGLPLLSFKEKYAKQLEKYEDTEVKKYVNEKKKEYEALQESLRMRNQTILRVGTAIIEKQKHFFFDKTKPLAPLQLDELAKELNLHESTISRAVNDTYIQTDTGTYELKSFFSRKHSQTGESTDSIQHALKKLINEENKKKPLSDQKLVDTLKEQGYDISRRTIAKYRSQLNIPSSTKRKRFDKK